MRKVFSSCVQSQTMLVRDALVHDGIEVTVLNENEGLSPVPAFQALAELWVTRDDDYPRAADVVATTMATLTAQSDAAPWTCLRCRESNPASFELCWNCGADRAAADTAG